MLGSLCGSTILAWNTVPPGMPMASSSFFAFCAYCVPSAGKVFPEHLDVACFVFFQVTLMILRKALFIFIFNVCESWLHASVPCSAHGGHKRASDLLGGSCGLPCGCREWNGSSARATNDVNQRAISPGPTQSFWFLTYLVLMDCRSDGQSLPFVVETSDFGCTFYA